MEKQIHIELDYIDVDKELLYYNELTFCIEVAVGSVSIYIDEFNILENVAEDYIYNLIYSFYETIDKNIQRSIIYYLDDPWKIALIKDGPTLTVEVYWYSTGKDELIGRYEDISFTSYQSQVLRLIDNFLFSLAGIDKG